MSIYSYKCEVCGQRYDVQAGIQDMDAGTSPCPSCSSIITRRAALVEQNGSCCQGGGGCCGSNRKSTKSGCCSGGDVCDIRCKPDENLPDDFGDAGQTERSRKNIFVIYDPPMCCSSGVCGPDQDQTLIKLQDTLGKLRASGVEVERYLITQSPQKFRENPEIIKRIQEQDLKVLPITTYNGKIVKTGSYPTPEEFQKFIHS
jgi:putative FmdB family regulatory protein